MQGVLAAEAAVLHELDAIGVVLLVLEGVVIPLLAFGAGQCDLYAHFSLSFCECKRRAIALTLLFFHT